jgi:acyl carrier protein
MRVEETMDRRSQSLSESNSNGGGITEDRPLSAEAIRNWLISELAQRLKIEAQKIDVRKPLEQYGLDSLDAVLLSGELEDWVGQPLSPTLLYEYPTIEALTQHLSGVVGDQLPQ